MRARLAVAGGIGVVLTALAAAFVFAPRSLLEAGGLDALAALVADRDPQRLLLGLGVLVGLVAAAASWAGGSASTVADGPATRYAAAVDDPPEAVSATDRALAGDAFDVRVEAAVDGDDAALDWVRETLAETVVQAYARTNDCSLEEARRAVAAGAWTGDPTAAAFVGDEPTFSVWARLREWLDPASERERRVRRTVAAVRSFVAGGVRP